MSTNTTQNVPGMIYPTQKGYAAGAGNPRDSAIQQMSAGNAKQAGLAAAVGGSRKKRGGGTIAVPTVPILYTPTGGPGTDPNSQIAVNMRTSTQGTANAVDDKQAMDTTPPAKGGSRKRGKRGKGKNGGNSNWLWGCYSGGKKSRRSKKKNTKKSQKCRKNKRKC